MKTSDDKPCSTLHGKLEHDASETLLRSNLLPVIRKIDKWRSIKTKRLSKTI